MQWLFTVLLIVVVAGAVGFAGYLVRRLFTTPPAADVATADVATAGVPTADVPTADVTEPRP